MKGIAVSYSEKPELVQNKSFSDRLIEACSVVLIASFYIFESQSYGKYVLFGISVLILLITAGKNSGRIRVKLDPFHYWIGGFALFCLASAVWATNRSEAISKGVTIIELLICMSCMYVYYREYGSVEQLLTVIMWTGYVVMAYSVLFIGVSETIRVITTSSRILTAFSNRNGVAIILMYSLLITLYRWLFRGFKALYLLSIPELVFILLIGSRKAFVGVIIGIALLFLYKIVSERQFKTLGRTVILLAAGYFIIRILSDFNIFSFVSHRMESIFNYLSGTGYVDNSTVVRNQMRAAGLQVFRANPILGIGFGNSYLYGIGDYTYFHDNFVEILSSGGILGFIIYYGMYVYILFKLLKNHVFKRSDMMLILIILILTLVMDYGSVSYYSKSTYAFFVLFFLSAIEIRRDKSYAE